jgi:hypothetical protein
MERERISIGEREKRWNNEVAKKKKKKLSLSVFDGDG